MEPAAPATPPKRSRKRILMRIAAGLLLYLALESLLPPDTQPSAKVCLGMIRAYQAIGSPLVGALGARCRWEPSCSHYAQDAIGHFGTLYGGLKTLGRLWRCSPWGGSGYDPAF